MEGSRALTLSTVGKFLKRLGPFGGIPERKQRETGVFFATDGLKEIFRLGSGIDRNADELTRATAFVTSAYCYSAMMWRASRVSQPALMVQLEGEDGKEWVPDHPLSEFFDTPRPDMDMAEILTRTMLYKDLTGQAIWVYDLRNDGSVGMVTPFAGHQFKVKPLGPLVYGQYEVHLSSGWTTVPRERVTHFRDVNPASWYHPVSRVDAALIQLDLGHHVNRIVRSLLVKAMFPGGIISPDEDWQPTPQEWGVWKSQVEAWHTGPANQGDPLIVPGGTTYTSVNRGMADLLPEAVLDRVEATLGSVFGVAPVVLGWLSGLKNSPWSQMSDARRQVYEDTVEPIWMDIQGKLSRSLLSPEERASGLCVEFDTSEVRALKDDEEQKARISSLNATIWTRNERRLFTGQDALAADDPRGEEIVSTTPVGPGTANVGNGNDPAAAAKNRKALADTKDLLWLVFDLETKNDETRWEEAIYAHLQALKASIIKLATNTLQTVKTADPHDQADFFHQIPDAIKKDQPKLLALVNELVLGTGGQAVKRLGTRLGLSFQVLEPGLAKYAGEEAAFLARVMGATTGKAVSETVQAGLNEGESVAGLIKRLQALPEFDRDRAKLVARTETTRAWNGAQRRSMSEYAAASGNKATKQWISSRDSRVRPEHVDLDDGTTIDINDTFANGLSEPGEPNCRCTLSYALADSSQD